MRTLGWIVTVFFVLTVVCFGVFMYYENFVIDSVPPVITSSLDFLECSVDADEKELMSELVAYDNKDGDLTDAIMIESISQLISKDTARVTYIVFDSSNNLGRYTRNVKYTDYEKPQFNISEPLVFAKNSSVTVSDRITANDVMDDDISDSIRVTAQNLDATEEGEYSITVQVTNSLGDTSTIPLTVIIAKDNLHARRQLVLLNEYLTYVEVGSDFNPWQYVYGVYDSEGKIKPKTVADVSSNVDTSTEGVYEVRYSYSDGGFDYTAILTVVVE